MPLLDHFHPPLSRSHPWRAFHGAWAAAMARLLNGGVLPPGYYAVSFLDRDGPVEIEVATVHEFAADASVGTTVAVEWPATDAVRVEVYTDEGDPKFVAAVELVSPQNKDRPMTRAAFAAKCAGYLSRGCGVVIVDVVTTRRADLHADLLAALGATPPASETGPLSAIAYRAVGGKAAGQLLAWHPPLEVGRTLPTLPLWLGSEFAVPLDLEASHTAACDDLRIRRAG